ncbi:PREDICTED: cyclin-dependent-like kinase 5 [Acropora digitifera]|uniref:cyclin-dependent-like kinase 5 n=1 Tax=Acropora digitifera TaxID=70779 RepID=UPI00077A7D94|nr:PREDICTED: cyclin-dependent-like kinase 5 [Acropora digitifera]
MQKYEKLEKIGEGTYGTVFKAKHKETHEIVALKRVRLDEDEEGIPSSALREICILKELKHKNIVRLHDVMHSERRLTLVFEYCDQDLKKYFDSCQGEVDAAVVKSFMFQLLRGLAFCHSCNVLHRDLKPQNLLINKVGNNIVVCVMENCKLEKTIALTIFPVNHFFFTTEIANGGRPLFPGGDVDDQLRRIFKVLGPPNEDTWPNASKLPDYKDFSYLQSGGAKLLVLNPAQRISAEDAMRHHFFSDLSPSFRA